MGWKVFKEMGFALFPVLLISAQVRNPRRKSSFFILVCCESVASHRFKVQSLAKELGKASREKKWTLLKGKMMVQGWVMMQIYSCVEIQPYFYQEQRELAWPIIMEDLFHSCLLKYPSVTFCYWGSSNLDRRKFPEDYSFLEIWDSLLIFPSMPDTDCDVKPFCNK